MTIFDNLNAHGQTDKQNAKIFFHFVRKCLEATVEKTLRNIIALFVATFYIEEVFILKGILKSEKQ